MLRVALLEKLDRTHGDPLARLVHRAGAVRANPRVALLADHYADDDWDALWWVRADGAGTVHEPGERAAVHAVELLQERYPQHRAEPPEGPVLSVDVTRWSGWSAR